MSCYFLLVSAHLLFSLLGQLSFCRESGRLTKKNRINVPTITSFRNEVRRSRNRDMSSSVLIGTPISGVPVATFPIARSSKMVERNGKCNKFLHFILHLIIIAGSLGVIYWGLVMGRVFVKNQKDYVHNPRIFVPQPNDITEGSDGTE